VPEIGKGIAAELETLVLKRITGLIWIFKYSDVAKFISQLFEETLIQRTVNLVQAYLRRAKKRRLKKPPQKIH
jgi:hypothetical protein